MGEAATMVYLQQLKVDNSRMLLISSPSCALSSPKLTRGSGRVLLWNVACFSTSSSPDTLLCKLSRVFQMHLLAQSLLLMNETMPCKLLMIEMMEIHPSDLGFP